MAPHLEGRNAVSSHEEELAHLRAQIEAKEKELAALKQDVPRGEIIHERIIHHKETPAEEVLAPSYRMNETEMQDIVLNLDPESDDATMLELRGIMETRGIHNALSVLGKLKNPHLEDDFHRFLVAYLIAGMQVKGLTENQPEWKALKMTLYEIALPEPKQDEADKDNSKYKHFKEIVSKMEQFYSGMMSVEEAYHGEPPHYSLELSIPVDNPHLQFYAGIPNSKCNMFEKQILAIFPNAVISVQQNDYNVFAQDGVAVGSVGRLGDKPPLSLKDFGEFDYDPINSILNAFAKVENEGEGVSLQFIIRPHGDKAVRHFRRVLYNLRRGMPRMRALSMPDDLLGEVFHDIEGAVLDIKPSKEHLEEATIKSVEAKVAAPVVETNMRIVVSSPDPVKANQVLGELESTFNQFEATMGNSIKWKRIKGADERKFFRNFSFRLFSPENAMLLSLRELTTMYHFPPKGIEATPHLKQSRFTSSAAPIGLGQQGIHMGTNEYRGSKTEVYMDMQDRLRHLYVIGQTGTGKTGFLRTLIEQDIKNGEGVCFIDPHGNDILEVLSVIPPERYNDVIYFDPAYIDRPFGLNMLEYDPQRPEQKTFIVNELLMIFRRLYGDVPESMGPAFEQYFRNATQLVMEDPESGSTMLDISRVLSNSEFRYRKLAKSNNLVVNQFWEEIATKAEGEASLQNIVPYITNKFDEFIANDFMRPIMGQQESSFKFRDIMDNRKILLVNLSKGRLGERNANLLGLIIVGKLFMSALSRADNPRADYPPFYLYIDEFQNITTDSIPGILSEARKYRLSMTIAHQFLKQVDEKIRDAVFGNVGSMAVFRVGEEDGEFFAKQFAPTFSALDFVNIENRNAYIRLLSKGVPQKPFNIRTRNLAEGNIAQVDDLRELSYLTYGRDRATVEATIRQRYLSL